MIFQQKLHLQCGFPREQQTSFVVELYLKSALAVAAGWGQLAENGTNIQYLFGKADLQCFLQLFPFIL